MGEISNLVRATRIERTIHIVAMMLIPVAFVDTLNLNLLILALCCILLYSGFSIHNGIQDGDYPLPKYAKFVFISMVALSIIISFYNFIILTAVIAWIVLGYIYNTISRKYLFADISVLTATNFGIPVFASSLLSGMKISESILISIFIYIIFWFISHTKNVVGWEEDKKRGYKTIATEFINHSEIIKIFFGIFFALLFSLYFLLNMHNFFLICLAAIVILMHFIFICLDTKDSKLGLKILRTLIILICLSFLVGRLSNISFVIIPFLILYSFSWILQFKTVLNNTKVI